MKYIKLIILLLAFCQTILAQPAIKVFKSGHVKLKEGKNISFEKGFVTSSNLIITINDQIGQKSIMLKDIELIQHNIKSKTIRGMSYGFAIGGGISLLAILRVNNDSSRRLKDNWYVPLGGLTALATLIGGLNGSKRNFVETIYEPSSVFGKNMDIGIGTQGAIGPRIQLTF